MSTSNQRPSRGETSSRCWASPVSSARRCASYPGVPRACGNAERNGRPIKSSGFLSQISSALRLCIKKTLILIERIEGFAHPFEYLARSGFAVAQGLLGPIPFPPFLDGFGSLESNGEIGDDRARFI